MNERHEATSFDALPAERFSDVLINRISKTREEISAIKSTAFWLSNKDYHYVRSLYKSADKDLLTLLSLRRSLDTKIEEESEIDPEESASLTQLEEEISVEVEVFPGESIHPFSANRVNVLVPSVKNHGSTFSIFVSLDDLRGEGVSDSIQALELIGENYIPLIVENPRARKAKINRELAVINKERIRIIQGENSKYSINQLNEVTTMIVKQKQTLIEY